SPPPPPPPPGPGVATKTRRIGSAGLSSDSDAARGDRLKLARKMANTITPACSVLETASGTPVDRCARADSENSEKRGPGALAAGSEADCGVAARGRRA